MQEAEAHAGDVGGGARLSGEDRVALLRLARAAVVAAVGGAAVPALEDGCASALLREPRACFVTLRRGGELRGCIGQLLAREPLWEAVTVNAARAATRDFRFAPVRREELGELRVEISVLTPPVPLAALPPEVLLERLRPGMDGVVLNLEGRSSTFLPQVWDELTDKRVFMERLSQKAGAEPGAWRSAEARVSVYQVEHFEEEDGR